MTYLSRSLCLSPVIAAALAAPASAMTFTWVDPDPQSKEPAHILAIGTIAEDDDHALEALLAEHTSATATTSRPPEVRFSSPGGDLYGGFYLGQMIRDHGLATAVEAGDECHSACTFAFLGGTERRIEGVFGIHAFSLGEGAEIGNVNEFVWNMQKTSADVVYYVHAMIGQDDMADKMLTFGSATTYEVSASEAAQWGIITHASTTSQELPAVGALAFCANPAERGLDAVHEEICTDLDLGRKFSEIGEMTAALASRPEAKQAVDEAPAFEISWQSCGLGGLLSLVQDGSDLDCARGAISARWQELKAMSDYLAALDSSAAASGWRRS